MPRPSFSERVSKLTTTQRIERAKVLIEKKLVDHVLEAIAIQESNEFIVYSDTVGKKVPRSYAAHAFNTMQSTMFLMGVLKVSSLWDKPDENTASIPTVVEYINSNDVIFALAEETRQAHAGRGTRILNQSNDPKLDAEIDKLVEAHQANFADSQAQKAKRNLRRVCTVSLNTLKSEELESVINARDKHIAHSLTETRREKKKDVKALKYGAEKTLLTKSINIVENLYLWVNGTSFDIAKDSRRIARQRAKELWSNVRFDIAPR